MDLLIKSSQIIKEEGLFEIVSLGKSGLEHIGFDILKIKEGNIFKLKKEYCETVIIILKGHCKVRSINQDFNKIMKRSSVFNENASAIYIPLNEEVEIDAKSDTEIGIGYADIKINHASQ